MNLLLWEQEPYHVNEQGVKWWVDETISKYAQQPDKHGTRLPITVCLIELPDTKERCYVAIYHEEIRYETQSYEGMGCWIDCAKMLVRDENKS